LRPSRGAIGWQLLSLLTTALFAPVFVLNWRALAEPSVFAPWLALAVIDPWLEETYHAAVERDDDRQRRPVHEHHRHPHPHSHSRPPTRATM
jgi:hypothetical protein